MALGQSQGDGLLGLAQMFAVKIIHGIAPACNKNGYMARIPLNRSYHHSGW